MPYKDKSKQREAQRKSYHKNKTLVRQRSKEQRKRNYAWLCEQKSAPCVDCNLTWPPYVMEYHHRDPTEKLGAVATLLINAGRQRVIDEIAKCDLLCSNCHRIREHGERLGYNGA